MLSLTKDNVLAGPSLPGVQRMSRFIQKTYRYWQQLLPCLLLLSFVTAVHAEIPTALTDTIKKGEASINLMKDVTSSELAGALGGESLLLGIDINEASRRPESATSQGVAIQDIELLITTTEGTFSYSTFYTNTTAMITAEGAAQAEEFHTLFGQTGSSQLTSSTTDFDISTFDDVIEIQNISYTGEIIDAQLNVSFVDTADTGGINEEFFDYSAGFEDVAILSAADAVALDTAEIGLADAPATIEFASSAPVGADDVTAAPTTAAPTTAAPTTATPSGGDIAAPSGAPEPHWFLLAALPALLIPRLMREKNAHKK